METYIHYWADLIVLLVGEVTTTANDRYVWCRLALDAHGWEAVWLSVFETLLQIVVCN